jgi:hypothetical protein
MNLANRTTVMIESVSLRDLLKPDSDGFDEYLEIT